MEKALFACDQASRIHHRRRADQAGKVAGQVDTKSVRKRMKDKAFARKVNRDDIVNGAAALGVDLDETLVPASKP